MLVQLKYIKLMGNNVNKLQKILKEKKTKFFLKKLILVYYTKFHNFINVCVCNLQRFSKV